MWILLDRSFRAPLDWMGSACNLLLSDLTTDVLWRLGAGLLYSQGQAETYSEATVVLPWLLWVGVVLNVLLLPQFTAL